MLSDAEFSHRLDVALAQMPKIFQHAIPFSDRMLEFGGSLLDTTVRFGSSINRASSLSPAVELRDPQKEQEAQAMEEMLRDIAKAESESRVEGLQRWLERAAEGRRMGEQCLSVFNDLSSCLDSMCDVTAAVQEQSNLLSSNASALMVRKTKLEMVQEELERMIKHFTRIEVLTREAENPVLSANSTRYPSMLQEMEEEMQFLSRNPNFLSSKVYATRLALSQQRAFQCLKDAIVESVRSAQSVTVGSDVYRDAFYRRQRGTSNDAANTEDPALKTTTILPLPGVDGSSDAQRAVADALRRINAIFCEKLSEKASLRRMLEAIGGDGESKDEVNDNEIFDAYRESRVLVVGPLLQNWLEAWCSVDVTAKPMPKLVNHLNSLMKIALAGEKEVFDEIWLREDFSARVFQQLVAGLSNEVYHVFRSQLLQVDELEELARTIEEIQWENTRQDNVAELSELLTKLIQDTQERLIFRTSVFLRQSIMRGGPTKAMLREFQSDGVKSDDSYIPALSNCVALLRILYPSLEFSVFSVFAEEAIHCALTQMQELARLMSQQRGENTAIKGLMCQLCHLIHLREELSRIDENITVVEKRIDLSKIAQRRVEIVQSSRESKKDVETEIKVCCERLVQMLFSGVSAPLSGVARKKPDEIRDAVSALEQNWTTQKELLRLFIPNATTREVLLRPVRARIDELLRETDSIQQQQQQQQQQEQPEQRTEGGTKTVVSAPASVPTAGNSFAPGQVEDGGTAELLQQETERQTTMPEKNNSFPARRFGSGLV
ncbi:hypothetical protein TcCL_NonESM09356 [Trypanosoma cruzi]|uniref:Conserved oligomeric Golgi complex subunit 3 n=1 Tax=Trypanosoma cruzi (strain CL Brener) TaxID=353153 RepID=Q4CT52_TRYCC|nr:hypothetical protein, conserved [Trypanosoma cruzi]EAN83454.1 hypothetical protein, conserved [Trypanosoma cruzi]RNC41098.1 hypothetical protein TcCL_NonESM09356 [Trypanosoma cruzi]|eukprot:XP_805305.1 hypothetical protein [Trypanosoma cruzi strain CL Brener]